MSGPNYIKALRASMGDSLLLLPGVAAVIHNSSKEILLQEKSEEIWSLPAGMIEPGESPKEAIVREVQEETGLVIVPSKILGVFGGTEFRYVYPNGDQVEYTVIVNLPANSSRFTGQQFLQWKCPINEFNRISTVSMEHLVADKLER